MPPLLPRLKNGIHRRLWPATSYPARIEAVARYLNQKKPFAFPPDIEIRLNRIETLTEHSHVYRWHHPIEGALVIHAWSTNWENRPAERHYYGGMMIEQANSSIPELMMLDASFATRREHGIELTIEREILGKRLADILPLDPSQISDLAHRLVRLHSHIGPIWGQPWIDTRVGKSLKESVSRRFQQLRDKLPEEFLLLSSRQKNQLLDNCHKCIDRIAACPPRLVHGDPNPRNQIQRPDERIVWLDFECTHFGTPWDDIVSLKLETFSNEKDFDCFLETYGEISSPSLHIRKDNLMLFLRLRLLELCCHSGSYCQNPNSTSEQVDRETREQLRFEKMLIDTI